MRHGNPSDAREQNQNRRSPERRTSNISVYGVRAVKLGVVESVEGLQTKFQRGRLFDSRDFAERHVVIVDSRPIEDSAVCGAECTGRVWGEQCGLECVRIVPRIVIDIERAKARIVIW